MHDEARHSTCVQACEQLDVDIITLDFTTRKQFMIRFPMVGVAHKRGIVFEIPYAPLVSGSCPHFEAPAALRG
jgi:RNase P/RNase MRP subunit p30